MGTRQKKRASQKERLELVEKANAFLNEKLEESREQIAQMKQDVMIWIQILQFDFMVDYEYQVALRRNKNDE